MMVADDDAPTLPSPDTKHWTVRRKAAVINGVRSGLLTIAEARERYLLSIEEYRSWEREFDRHGEAGLRSTRVGIYRKPPRMR